MNLRKTALSLLREWEERRTYINISVNAATEGLPDRDRAFLVSLVYGTVERQLTLDYLIGAISKRSPKEIDPHLRDALRLGLYQLLYLSGVADHAAVNETVKLGRNAGERGFLYGVLRAALRQKDDLPFPQKEKNPDRYLSVVHSVPLWIVKRFRQDFGEETEALLRAINEPKPLCLRTNTAKTDRDALLSRLREAGIAARPTPSAPHGILVDGPASPTGLPGFDEGEFWVQDEASQIATAALDAKEGNLVLDLCACPGGKSFGAAADMKNQGRVVSYDLHPSKLPLITKSARRLGLTAVTAAPHDATERIPEWEGRADRVICDVPCSGLGVLGKKPDLRYREEEGILTLPLLQYSILENAASYLKKGGILVYSTCTLGRAENQEIATRFVAEHPEFAPESFTVGNHTAQGGMLMLTPHRDGTDGFFIFRLRRL